MFPNVEYIKTIVNGLKVFVASSIKSALRTIDPKHIKDMYYAESEEKNISGMKIIDVTYDGTEHDPLPFALGQVWNAKFDTTHYDDLEVKQANDGTLYIGDMNVYSPPFFVSVTSGGYNSSWYYMMQPGPLALTGVSGTMVETVAHTVPDKYISAKIARKSDIIAQVQADWGESNTNSMAFIRNKPTINPAFIGMTYVTASSTVVDMDISDMILLVFTQNSEAHVPLLRVYYNEKYYTIMSSKTGKALTEDECPYGCMVLARYGIRFYCANPL